MSKLFCRTECQSIMCTGTTDLLLLATADDHYISFCLAQGISLYTGDEDGPADHAVLTLVLDGVSCVCSLCVCRCCWCLALLLSLSVCVCVCLSGSLSLSLWVCVCVWMCV